MVATRESATNRTESHVLPGSPAVGRVSRAPRGKRSMILATQRVPGAAGDAGWAVVDMVESEIRRFITDRFCYGEEGVPFGSDDSLIGRGIVDSTGVIEIVTFLQDAYGIRVEDEEIVPDNLDSIARLSKYVQRKTGEPALEA